MFLSRLVQHLSEALTGSAPFGDLPVLVTHARRIRLRGQAQCVDVAYLGEPTCG
jgi:hypothetical protein